MEKRKDFHDFSAIEIDLSVLEQTLNHIKDTLIKKLGCLIPENDSVETNSSRYSFMGGSSGIKTTQVTICISLFFFISCYLYFYY